MTDPENDEAPPDLSGVPDPAERTTQPVGDVMERELKLRADRDLDFGRVDGLAVHETGVVRLDAEYHDTPDLRLLTLGHTLRHRSSSDGTAARWTLKLAGSGDARREIDVVAAEGMEVPVELRSLVAGIIGDRPIAPVATISTRRERHRSTFGGADIEIAVDDVDGVRLAAGTASPTAFRQIELELLGGDEAALHHLADELADQGAERWQETKLGIVLGDALRAASLAPVRLTKKSSVDDLVRAAVVNATRQLLLHEPHLRGDPSVESVHRARVATRRLRSDLATLRPLLDRAAVDPLRTELAWLGSVIGRVRDLDVLDAHIVDWLGRIESASRFDAVRAELRSQRSAAVREMHEALDSRRAHDLVDALRAWSEAPRWAKKVDHTERARHLARRRTRHAQQRLASWIHDLDDTPADEALHEARKRAKRVRYAAELMSPVLGGDLDDLAEAATSLQDVLGGLQDAAVGTSWLATVEEDRLTAADAFAAGQMVQLTACDADAARADWHHSWRTLRKVAKRRLH